MQQLEKCEGVTAPVCGTDFHCARAAFDSLLRMIASRRMRRGQGFLDRAGFFNLRLAGLLSANRQPTCFTSKKRVALKAPRVPQPCGSNPVKLGYLAKQKRGFTSTLLLREKRLINQPCASNPVKLVTPSDELLCHTEVYVPVNAILRETGKPRCLHKVVQGK